MELTAPGRLRWQERDNELVGSTGGRALPGGQKALSKRLSIKMLQPLPRDLLSRVVTAYGTWP
jgi:hypothetical protein